MVKKTDFLVLVSVLKVPILFLNSIAYFLVIVNGLIENLISHQYSKDKSKSQTWYFEMAISNIIAKLKPNAIVMPWA